jgi:CelD/BcsL family acetyltransferase involved in cellulose biosynthesis
LDIAPTNRLVSRRACRRLAVAHLGKRDQFRIRYAAGEQWFLNHNVVVYVLIQMNSGARINAESTIAPQFIEFSGPINKCVGDSADTWIAKGKREPEMTQAVRSRFQISGFSGDQEEVTHAQRGCLLDSVALSVYEDLSVVEDEWRAFQQYADGTVFQTFEWFAAWQQNVGPHEAVRPAVVGGRDGKGNLLFLLPLAIRSARFAKALVWLGSDLCDYNGPLLAPYFSKAFDVTDFPLLWKAITQELAKNPRLAFDFAWLEKMPGSVGDQPNPMLSLKTVRNPSGAYRTQLASSWEEFYRGKRSSATRRRDRSKRKRLAALGELRFVEPADATASLAALEKLMHQKARSFARMGVGNLFERPGYAEFFRALATDAGLSNLVHVSQLNVGAQPVAVNLGLTFRQRYYHVLSSYTDKGEIARFGPGAAHLHDLLRHAIERGYRCYDFTIGDEEYKTDWCDQRDILYDHLQIHTLRGALIGLPLFAKQRLKALTKQQPLLWSALKRMRALMARSS